MGRKVFVERLNGKHSKGAWQTHKAFILQPIPQTLSKPIIPVLKGLAPDTNNTRPQPVREMAIILTMWTHAERLVTFKGGGVHKDRPTVPPTVKHPTRTHPKLKTTFTFFSLGEGIIIKWWLVDAWHELCHRTVYCGRVGGVGCGWTCTVQRLEGGGGYIYAYTAHGPTMYEESRSHWNRTVLAKCV